MKRFHIQHLPSKVSDIRFEEYYDELSRDWETKAQKLQARRWRALKRNMKLHLT